MTDLFNEVDEQLRSDRLKELALKASPWLLGIGLALIVAAFAIWGWRRHEVAESQKASSTYAQAVEAMQNGQTDVAGRLLGQVAKSGPAGYKTLALMQQAALELSAGKAPAAVALFDQAAKAAPDPILGDAARLKAAFAVMDTAPYKEVETRLLPLTEETRPYRVQAREALAFAKLASGDTAGARSDFVVISLLPGVSEGARGRAEAAKALIDSGSAKAVPEAIKLAAAAPLQPMVAGTPALPPPVAAPAAEASAPPTSAPAPKTEAAPAAPAAKASPPAPAAEAPKPSPPAEAPAAATPAPQPPASGSQ